MNQILCTPREAIKFRHPHTPAELDWAETISDFYTARPIKGDATNFYTFVADVFAAGRISGVREERARRKGAARHE
ncbi:MAG TPA: hypothetical protein K8V20_00530 [Subdoligranulum variabile]|uniref:Uncharacterized protein n=1 Tax=Subdoligranulum variabile TaxID=214851 RepID=A0A921II94_9FIRM|nr:hypothetical protein [Subdoligranulum variabile]